ncbi:MobF family relaxase [Novosphingobium sp. CECT 9465]|uniref:MobF family relaxase n=1 Tax=Novosphingobium sp. CECT 9465 TaxID=2829794 RepID=UPI001E531337|nr:MobF family relaxase [Novosphingobium sp. CECT 9465]CAH0496008.1 ATP-dependent RecD-like DNA helicase [Novosphingobium sp. CECT 9465]
MLSVANVRTAGGAARYFAADNYYSRADADRSGEWFGAGAEKLGLSGQVEVDAFEAVLKGFLPDGTRLGTDKRPHRAGTDLTFSMPKSWSLLALVGGDRRILDAYAGAVRETLGWAERNLAETRIEVRGKDRVVATGNLVAALFVHDTNRNQEPNAHIHAVIANATQGPDGKWRSLRNDKLWEHNTLLNAMVMARFRLSVEQLGYEVGERGKHGSFEAAGVPKSVRDAFSSRRAEVLNAVAHMASQGPAARDAATLMTRAKKAEIEDRAALVDAWRTKVAEIRFDPAQVIACANSRAASGFGEVGRAAAAVQNIATRAKDLALALAAKFGRNAGDPLMPSRMAGRDAQEIAAIHAVASAVRHLSEREAAFSKASIIRAALGFGLPAATPAIERRIDQLVRQGQLVRGRGANRAMLTTPHAVDAETRIIAAVEDGRGHGEPIVHASEAGARAQALSQLRYGMTLNRGQETAARLLLGSANRIVAIQGVAGAGKSTVLKPVAEILREEGRAVLGLAVQNTLVRMLERETGIPSMTVARFLGRYRDLLDNPESARLQAARAEMRGSVVLLDEASMVGNADNEKLVRLANVLEVARFASIGDRKQLGAVDAGKPFDVMQRSGIETAVMDTNLRARDARLRDAQAAAQEGDISGSLEKLGMDVLEVREGAALRAAAAWLALSPDDRERTAIYASGRALRSEINSAVQTGLRANGELGREAIALDVLSRVNVSHEELRYAGSYRPGMILNVDRTIRSQKIGRGTWSVGDIDLKTGRIALANEQGAIASFRPDKLRPSRENAVMRVFEAKSLELRAGDRIRWTDTDHKRGLVNADQARITEIRDGKVCLITSTGITHELAQADPMLRRLDLAYALNAHMAQGLTSDRGIAVMDSRERNLSNQQTFLVTITRLRDGLTLFVNNASRLEAAVERNPGTKQSAIETIGALREPAAAGSSKGDEVVSERKEPERERAIVKPWEIGI